MRRVLIACALALAACGQGGTARSSMVPGLYGSYHLAPADLPAFFDCLRERSATIVSAHRGGPAPGYAENAIRTFEQTLDHAPAFLEVDVARTRDGVLVLMHDDTVDRTTTGSGRVSDLTAAEFVALRLQDERGVTLDAHPPTLRDALFWAEGRTVLELDVKRGVSYEEVARAVRSAGALYSVVFVTYSVDGAARLARVAPEAMMYVTVESERDLNELERRGVDLSHVVAWTGIDEPNSVLNVALAARGVEARFGTLGGSDSWDARFAREQGEQYAAFADTGLAIIATDRPVEAFSDLDTHDGAEDVAAMQCTSAQ